MYICMYVCLYIYIYIYIYINLLTAIGLTPGGRSAVCCYTQTIRRTIPLIWEECWPCPFFASYTLVFALHLREKHGKTSARLAEECQLLRCKENIRNRIYIPIRIHECNNKNV